MNIPAVTHRGRGIDCYPLDEHTFRIRLTTAKGDFDRAELCFCMNKYAWSTQRRTLPLPRIAEDDTLDYYQIDLTGDDTRLCYLFLLYHNGECFYFSEEGLSRTYDFERAYYTFFQYPYIFPCNVHRHIPWTDTAVMYQIFPERFANGMGEKPYITAPWDAKPTPRMYLGGDLPGVTQHLDYLSDLGVNCLYFTPIHPSPTNHKYSIVDYYDVDAGFGGQAAFRELVQAAHARGMRVLLDGVFSHTGDDSLYFNRYGRYDTVGAYQSPDSPYAGWFTFEHFPDKYKCWWGVDTLPEVNKENEDYRQFILSEEGVARRWVRAGTSGWRLDVADELPMRFLRDLRTAVRAQDDQAALLGEVWEDASNKVSYGAQRCYCLGDTLDSVMNYPLREAAIGFVTGALDAYAFCRRVESLHENYPLPFFYSLMNLMGSHDRPRILNVLAGNDGSDIPRSQRADHRLSQEERMIGALREQLMLRFVFSVPGMPCIYYGDEAGVEGCADPFCRRTYPWGREDQDMLARYKAMAAMRNGHPVLKTGECAYIAPCSAVLGVIRKNENGKDAFGKKAENACAVTLINRSAREVVVYLTSADVSGAQTLVSDDGQIFTARSGAFSVKIKGLQGMTMFAM